jgi:hypothetical protein
MYKYMYPVYVTQWKFNKSCIIHVNSSVNWITTQRHYFTKSHWNKFEILIKQEEQYNMLLHLQYSKIIYKFNQTYGSQGSSVSMVTDYGLDN